MTKQPGVDFSQEANGLEAYFECMNDNGGIDGRPVKLAVAYEQSNPQEVASDATKLLNTEHVLGMVGSMSLSDCAVNEATYKKEGIYAIGPGVNEACYQQPNYASTIGGPTNDLETATRYLFQEFGDTSGFAVAQTQCPSCAAFNGLQVWPRDVEDVLYQHPEVVEAAVVGVPDDNRGESVRAYVTLRPRATATEEDLIGHCREILAAYKRPREVVVLAGMSRRRRERSSAAICASRLGRTT